MKIAVNQQTGGDGTTETGAGTTPTANVPASRWCRRHTAVLAAGAALSTAVACGLGATAIASAAPTHAQQAFGSSARHVVERATATLASPEVMLPAGKVGTRSQIPWGQVGSGWALAEYTKATIRRARMVTLYLIDPAGGMYSEYRWPSSKSAWTLVDWSGDKARALFTGPAAGHQVAMHQLMLATGKVVSFPLPASVQPLAYTRPSGKNMLAFDRGVVRYNLAGVFQARLTNQTAWAGYGVISSPDGMSVAVPAKTGVTLVSNANGKALQLPVPVHGGCVPVRWWNSGTLLASCIPPQTAGPQLWLVPVNGARPTALTPVRNGRGPDLGDMDAWRMDGGEYLQALGGCGTVFIGKQEPRGAVKVINVPDSSANNLVVVTTSRRMLVSERVGCMPSVSLVWFNPLTSAVQRVLTVPPSELGVISVVAYNRDASQPAFMP